MKVLTFYIIRSVETGWYLPPGSGSGGRGTTHQELAPPCETRQPKLFHTEAAARLSLSWWLKGVTSVHVSKTGSPWDGHEIDERWETEFKADRKPELMEIATVELRL